jgi:pimeloyl-ACP methyl ester carboxylesterase
VLCVDLAFDRTGSGPALVLLHGVGTRRAIWRRALPHLAAERTVISPDLPGFGDSPPAGEGFDLADVADRLVAGVSEAAGGSFDLLGHSLGGAIATVIAARHPDEVRRLLLSAPAGFAPRPAALARAAGALAAPALGLRRAVALPLASSALARRVALAGAVHNGSRLDPDDARLLLTASRGAHRLGAAVAGVAALDLRDELRRVRCPIGLIWGERDLVIRARAAAAIVAVRGPVPMETIPGAGHVSQIERPAEFAAAIDRLLEAL